MKVIEIVEKLSNFQNRKKTKYRCSSFSQKGKIKDNPAACHAPSHPGKHYRLAQSKLEKQPIIKGKQGWTNQRHNIKPFYKRKKLR